MVRFSYGDAAQHSAAESVELIKLADALGFHGAYQADDPRERDSWLVAAAAARETTSIRLGLSATGVYIREPTLIAQGLATLDQLSGGRADSVVSFGDVSLLELYRIEASGGTRLARLREAVKVMRTYLDDGAVTHDGEHFRYSGLVATVRPVQQRLPLLIGAMGGPRSFELAGEIGDGAHVMGCSAVNSRYAIDHIRRGAERAGRDWRQLDIVVGSITAVSEERAAAKQAARLMLAYWLPSLPANLLERHGVNHDSVAPITTALQLGQLEAALDLISPVMVDAFTISGTPEECVKKIRTELVDAGVEHVLLALADPFGLDGKRPPGVDGLPAAADQLKLIASQVFPSFD